MATTLSTSQYNFERLSQANIHHLVGLYRDVFHKKITLEFILRKYDTQAFGVACIGYIAFSTDGQPAAFYGVLPCIVQLDGQRVLAAQSADTMTHPAHQKKGLFLLLAQKTYDLARKENIRFIFGFPNQNSYNGFVKLGWQFMPGQLQRFTVGGSFFPYAKLLYRSRLLSKVHYAIARTLLSTEGVMKLGDEQDNGILRDKKFVEYKRYSKTLFSGISGSSYAWLKADGTLKVGLISPQKDLSARTLISQLKRIAFFLGCGEVIFITNKNSTLYNLLLRLRKPVDALPVGFYNLSSEEIDFSKLTFEYCDIDIF